MVWVERDFKAHAIPSPAMDSDTFHCPGVLQPLSNLVLGPSKHGAAAASLGNSKQINPIFYIGTLCYWNRPV